MQAMGTLWWNGTFFTMVHEGDQVEAVFTEDGKIVAIGTAEELRQKYRTRINQEMNCDGAYVYPGFVDSHLHMIGHGEKLLRLDLSTVMNAEDMREKLMERVALTEEGDWVTAEGWNENNFPDQKIFHRNELDEIAPNHPMILTRVCRHAILVNSKALQLAGISKDTTDPPGGRIVRDELGEPTGYLLDTAQELVKRVAPSVSAAYLERALAAAVDDMVAKGLVGGHTEDLGYYLGFNQTFATFQRVIDGNTRRFRAHLLVHHEVIDDMIKAGYCKGPVGEWLEFGAMKIFADGAFGGRTALLSEPYCDAPTTSGVAIHTQEQLTNLIKKARQYKLPVAIHTIGDEALRMAITSIEAHPVTEGRDRLIHTQVTPPSLVERMKKLKVILDIQPAFVPADFPWVEERLGNERLSYSFAWKTLLRSGMALAGGSDAPIEEVDPLYGIYAAVARKKPTDQHEGYLPEEKLTRYEALQLYTTGSAYAIEREHERGNIRPGYVADFTMLNRNLFTCREEELLTTRVEKTVIGEAIVFQA